MVSGHRATINDLLAAARARLSRLGPAEALGRPVIDHYHRADDGLWTLRTLEVLEARLHLETIGCTVSLADVYERVAQEVGERAGGFFEV